MMMRQEGLMRSLSRLLGSSVWGGNCWRGGSFVTMLHRGEISVCGGLGVRMG